MVYSKNIKGNSAFLQNGFMIKDFFIFSNDEGSQIEVYDLKQTPPIFVSNIYGIEDFFNFQVIEAIKAYLRAGLDKKLLHKALDKKASDLGCHLAYERLQQKS